MKEFKIMQYKDTLDSNCTTLCWMEVPHQKLVALEDICKNEALSNLVGHYGLGYGSEKSPESANFYIELCSKDDVPQELVDRVIKYVSYDNL